MTAYGTLDSFLKALDTKTHEAMVKKATSDFDTLKSIMRKYGIAANNPVEVVDRIIAVLEDVRDGKFLQGGDLDHWGTELINKKFLFQKSGAFGYFYSDNKLNGLSLGTLALYIYALDKPDVRTGFIGRWLNEEGRKNAALLTEMLQQLNTGYSGKLKQASGRAQTSCRDYGDGDCVRHLNEICQLVPNTVQFSGPNAKELRNLLDVLCKLNN